MHRNAAICQEIFPHVAMGLKFPQFLNNGLWCGSDVSHCKLTKGYPIMSTSVVKRKGGAKKRKKEIVTS
jgi:hypothetical protein